MQSSFFNRLVNVFDSGEKPAISEHHQSNKNDFSNIIVDHVVGRRHQNYFEECEDYSGYAVSDVRSTIAISDGCSSAKEAITASKISVEYALEFFQERDWVVTGSDEKSQKDLVADFIEALQDAFRTSGKEFKQLSATLAVASFDKISNQYLLLNIGDGYISAYLNNSACEILLHPFNRDGDLSRTCFGNSDDVVELAQIEIGNISEKDYTGFMICSDGASSLYDVKNLSYGKRTLSFLADATKNLDEKAVHEKMVEIQSQQTYDDVSVGIMLITSNDVLETKIADLEESDSEISDENLENEIDSFEATRMVLEKADIPIQIGTLIMKNFEKYHELSIEELLDIGLCKKGKILSTLLPLIQEGILIYQDDKFVLSQVLEV